jgi:Plasmid replication region DNA-binding N-term
MEKNLNFDGTREAPTRRVSAAEVNRAADALLRAGQAPSIAKIRETLRGSPNTILKLLNAWWANLFARLDQGPPALHRLPASVALAAEALWYEIAAAGRESAQGELKARVEVLARGEDYVEGRAHALNAREADLQVALETLKARVQGLTKELKATRRALARAQAHLELRRPTRPVLRSRTPRPEPRKKPIRRLPRSAKRIAPGARSARSLRAYRKTRLLQKSR